VTRGSITIPLKFDQSRRFTAIHLPPGIDPQMLSHKTRQLSVTTRAERRLLTARPYPIPAASVRSIDRVV
jgi:hypothetical protein